jgi:Uma2 family endonuclease
MATVSRLITYEDWLAMPPAEAGREEVVNGELQTLPPNRYMHAVVIHNLTLAISAQIDRTHITVLGSNVSLLISQEPLACRAPDLVMYWRESMVRDRHDVLCSPPDLVIEVLSPSETKRRKQGKLDDYARIGVPEAWIISPEAETVEIRLLVDGKLSLSKIITEGNLQPTRFPGVVIPVAEIWPE